MINNLSTYELVSLLLKKNKQDIKSVLISLMLEDKLDFADISSSYIEFMKMKSNKENMNCSELNACILQLMFFADKKKKLTEIENEIVQRALYSLNKYKYFKLDYLNEKFSYIGDDKAKKLTCYKNDI